jgi:hypothetical protein
MPDPNAGETKGSAYVRSHRHQDKEIEAFKTLKERNLPAF